ncbi:hypothetical protein [Paracoccus alcaliphilus]|uniref:hypothetical protein n=1 Tax=Paracoccus alcaliphilus TaxID=34002 RepID=UPI0023508023|nr:hypothetical protein [Paracoccus alcaliphilus]WCR18605.1 hypothetical protein JHW40_02325 [Paracoccus alcaliphilus]
MDGPAFATCTREILIPEIEPGTVVILDNLATHRNKQAAEALRAHCCRFRYAPFRPNPELTIQRHDIFDHLDRGELAETGFIAMLCKTIRPRIKLRRCARDSRHGRDTASLLRGDNPSILQQPLTS